MKAVLLVMFILVLAGAAAVTPKLMKNHRSGAKLTPSYADTGSTSSVRVRQELVIAVEKAETVDPRPLPERRIAQRAVRQPQAAHQPQGRATLLQKSRMLLLGNGTNRPEPFPRAR